MVQETVFTIYISMLTRVAIGKERKFCKHSAPADDQTKIIPDKE
jgi:hypothetical protein